MTSSGFADIQTAFERARWSRNTIELFGDNYHHRGNYGPRLYFSEILPHLLSSPLTPAEVPAYVQLP